MKRLRSFLTGASPAMMVGAFFALGVFRLGAEQAPRSAGLLVGALYGLAVLGVLRLFRVAPWGLWFVGLVAGPVPAALLAPRGDVSGDRAGVWAITALLGLLIGGIEHARLKRDER